MTDKHILIIYITSENIPVVPPKDNSGMRRTNTVKVGDIVVIVNDQEYCTSASQVVVVEQIQTSNGKACIVNEDQQLLGYWIPTDVIMNNQ